MNDDAVADAIVDIYLQARRLLRARKPHDKNVTMEMTCLRIRFCG
jgi:hypothetical protein